MRSGQISGARAIAFGLTCSALWAAAATSALADEGMWTFNNVPRALLKDRYKVELSDLWLEHVRLSSVRFNSGGSGSFVSDRGLVMTNHHVGADCINKLGATGRDYIKDGFYAKNAADEIKCPDLELNVLTGIEDVTKDVRGVEKPGMDEAAINKAQKEKMAAIEKACADKTHERCDVVTLYQGGVYNLYHYKKYTDVRLAFAPEFQIAFFGGDPDNFEFPRYDLDVAFFRVYEGGQAVHPKHYLKWSERGASEGELVFTSGNPGNTERLDTVAQLEILRDTVYPTMLADLKRQTAVLKAYSQKGPDEERQARTPIFALENWVKAYTGYLAGLTDKALMAKKVAGEQALQKQVAAQPDKQKTYGGVWDAVAAAQKTYATLYKRYSFLEGRSSRLLTEFNPLNSTLFGIARTLVRLGDEKQKPGEKRLREYRDSNLASIELELYSEAPLYPKMEELLITGALERLEVQLGPTDPAVKAALAGKRPADRAKELVAGTKLADVAVRKQLGASKAALDASKDPMIILAKALDADARTVRHRFEDEVEGVVKKNLGLLGRAQFETEGLSHYPDATFTLRLSFGTVAGYADKGKKVPPMTTFGGLFVRSAKAGGKAPWEIPKRWVDAKSKLKPTTPMDFVSTNDIIGGNSGSPVVNQAGEVVGLVFDGNIHSLSNNFVPGLPLDRAISVHSVALIEALRKVYDAGQLADELQPQKHAAR
jgi:hypothetical protein